MISFCCPTCSTAYRVADAHAGQRVSCAACRGVLHVPAGNGEQADRCRRRFLLWLAGVVWAAALVSGLALGAVLVVALGVLSPDDERLAPMLGLAYPLAMAAFIAAVVTHSRGASKRCPACREWWARVKVATVELGSKRAMKVVTRTDGWSGSVDLPGGRSAPVSGSSWRREQVMVLRVRYRDDWACLCCPHRWSSERAVDYENFDLD